MSIPPGACPYPCTWNFLLCIHILTLVALIYLLQSFQSSIFQLVTEHQPNLVTVYIKCKLCCMLMRAEETHSKVRHMNGQKHLEGHILYIPFPLSVAANISDGHCAIGLRPVNWQLIRAVAIAGERNKTSYVAAGLLVVSCQSACNTLTVKHRCAVCFGSIAYLALLTWRSDWWQSLLLPGMRARSIRG